MSANSTSWQDWHRGLGCPGEGADQHRLPVLPWRRARWVGGGMAALVLHASVAAAIVVPWSAADVAQSTPAAAPVMIDLAPVPVMPQVAAAVAPPPEPMPDPEPALIPETPPAKAAEVVLKASPPKPEKPKAVAPKPPKKVVAQKVPKPAPEAPPQEDALPMTEAPAAVAQAAPAVAAAPAVGALSSSQRASAEASWQARLLSHLERNKRYPRGAQMRRQQGVVQVAFTVNRDGTVLAAALEKSSDYPALNDEAVSLVSRASPVPAPPAGVPGQTVQVVVPIQFFLR